MTDFASNSPLAKDVLLGGAVPDWTGDLDDWLTTLQENPPTNGGLSDGGESEEDPTEKAAAKIKEQEDASDAAYKSQLDHLDSAATAVYGDDPLKWQGTGIDDFSTLKGLRQAAKSGEITGTDFYSKTGRIYSGGTGDVAKKDAFGNIQGYVSPDGSGSALHSGTNAMTPDEWAATFPKGGQQMRNLSGNLPNTPNPMISRNPKDAGYKSVSTAVNAYAY